jgi:hypothetical protein
VRENQWALAPFTLRVEILTDVEISLHSRQGTDFFASSRLTQIRLALALQEPQRVFMRWILHSSTFTPTTGSHF